jgi:hypothetical protein
MECFGTTDFDNNSRLITLSAIIISGLHCIWRKCTYYNGKAETLVVASKEIRMGVNAEETKYMVMSRDQNAGRSHSMKSDNSSFEMVEEFRYLGTTLPSQHLFRKKLRAD